MFSNTFNVKLLMMAVDKFIDGEESTTKLAKIFTCTN